MTKMNFVSSLLISTLLVNANWSWNMPTLKFKGASNDFAAYPQLLSHHAVKGMCVVDGDVFVTLGPDQTILVFKKTHQISQLVVPLGPSWDVTHSHTAIFPSPEANSSLYILDTRLPEHQVYSLDNEQVAESMKTAALLWKVELMPGGTRRVYKKFDDPIIFHVSPFTGNYVILSKGNRKSIIEVYKNNWKFGRLFELAMNSAHPDNLVELPDGTFVVLSSIKPYKYEKHFLTKLTADPKDPGQISNMINLDKKDKLSTGMAVDHSGNIYVNDHQSLLVADKDLTQVNRVQMGDDYRIEDLYITPQSNELYLVGKDFQSQGSTVVRVYDIEPL